MCIPEQDSPVWRRLFHAGESGTPWWAHTANAVAALLLISAFFYYCLRQVGYEWNWGPVWVYRQKFVTGWLVTIGISAAALLTSTFIGVATALIRRSRILILHHAGTIYVELIRSTPLLVQILIFFYVIANAAGVQNRYVAGVAILSLFAGAYISEIVRSGIENIAESQLESARAIGLSEAQTYRYVIFPQAIRQVLPPLTGQFVSLIKDSSLLSIIAIEEFTLNAQEVNANTYSGLESYLPLAAGYLLLTLPLSLWTRRLEHRFRYAT
jgi:polar amino acid transport system permease protein